MVKNVLLGKLSNLCVIGRFYSTWTGQSKQLPHTVLIIESYII